MRWFLRKKWNLHVHRFIISRMLKKKKWNNKKAHRFESQNEKFCQYWIVDLLDLIAKQLIFIDETMFNETIEWRFRIYAFVDQSTRYHDDICRKRKTWNVLSIYISNDRDFIQLINFNSNSIQIQINNWLWTFFLNYLFDVDVKKDYYNEDDFYQWICDNLLLHCNIYSTNHSVIIMNNVNIHINQRIQ